MRKAASLKPLFPGLEFSEEGHKYTVDGLVFPSVSSLIKEFYDQFDFDGVSEKYAAKNGFPVEMVRQAWVSENSEANRTGHIVHDFAEKYALGRYINNAVCTPSVPNKQALGVLQYYNDLPSYVEVVDLELKMYSKRYRYCGTADKIFFNRRDNYYVISDWKTNKELFGDPKWARRMKHGVPVNQDNFGKYSLQMSFYQILLEEAGLTVGSRVIVWLNSAGSKLYSAHKTMDLTKELRDWLGKR